MASTTCFVHVPKTGGSWVTKGLHSAVPEERRHEVPSADVGRVTLRWLLQQYAFVSGHFTMAEVSHVVHDTFVFTFLREPVDRVISLYHFYREQPGAKGLDPRVAQVQAQDFECFVESLTSRVSPWSNWQTYVLSGCAHCELPARNLLPGALANLQQLDFVGVQEDLASGLAALAQLRHWTVTPPSGPVNVTRSRPKRDALPPSVIRKLQELNNCDAELYEAALQRWHALQGKRKAPRPPLTVARHWSHRREMGTREIEITSATIDVVHGTVRVRLKSRIAEPNLTVGIRIVNQQGLEVFSTNTRLERRPLPANPGDHLLAQFDVKGVLQSGAHFLTVAAHRGADHLEGCFHWIDNVAQFTSAREFSPSSTRDEREQSLAEQAERCVEARTHHVDLAPIANRPPGVLHSAQSVTLQSTAAETAGSSRLPPAGRVFSLCLAVLCVVTMAAQAPKIDTSQIGPRVGQKVPHFSGTDQLGRKHTLASSLGAKGAMLVFFRSADW